MLIKIGYPKLLHVCDFLCLNVMNYYEFEKDGRNEGTQERERGRQAGRRKAMEKK